MATMHSEERIGEAWRLHRNGDSQGAIDIFKEILDRTPENIDANYGLALAYRGDNNDDSARETLQHALKLTQKALEAVRTTSSADGHAGGNDLDTYEDDRYMMLIRMTKQRLVELGVDVDPNVVGVAVAPNKKGVDIDSLTEMPDEE